MLRFQQLVLADTWWHTFSKEGCGIKDLFCFLLSPLVPMVCACRLSALYSCSLPAEYGEMLLTNKWSTSPQIGPKKKIWQLQLSADVSGQLCGLSSAEFHCSPGARNPQIFLSWTPQECLPTPVWLLSLSVCPQPSNDQLLHPEDMYFGYAQT